MPTVKKKKMHIGTKCGERWESVRRVVQREDSPPFDEAAAFSLRVACGGKPPETNRPTVQIIDTSR